MIGSPESGNEKTPMPTPRLEKKELFMTTSSSSSNTVKYSNSGTMPVQSLPSSSSRDSLSPTSRIVMDHASLSGTSPTGSAHSNGTSSGGGSNDITPMPTPRAGSPIAGLKMTSLTKSQQPSSSSSTTTNTFSNQLPPKMDQEFQLMDSASFTLNTSSRGIRKMKTQEDQESKQEVQSITVDNEEVDHAILKVTPVVNILALGGLLEDTLSPPLNHPGDSATSPASSVGSTVPSLSVATGSSPEPDNSSADDQYQSEVFARSSREYKSDKLSVRNNDTGAKVQLETVVTATETHDDNDVIVEEEEEEDECDGDGIEEDSKADFDKTPTLHASMELPKLNDTTNHTLHARYRKKRTVGIPHVTAKKRALPTSSKKSRKP